ncbi:MAG: hypothetical protein M1835_006557 [Candelina submexicana]|nr:MAG: hypothetical protein M1835_006557 [Candelina submexicana]
MELHTRNLSIALRILQMVHAIALIGLLASLLHATRFAHYKDNFIAITALAVLSLLLAILLLSRALRRFIHYPIDLLLVPLWLAATVALGLSQIRLLVRTPKLLEAVPSPLFTELYISYRALRRCRELQRRFAMYRGLPEDDFVTSRELAAADVPLVPLVLEWLGILQTFA